MSQDQFDKRLKESFEGYYPKMNLEQEFNQVSSRILAEKKKKRKLILFWFLLGTVVITSAGLLQRTQSRTDLDIEPALVHSEERATSPTSIAATEERTEVKSIDKQSEKEMPRVNKEAHIPSISSSKKTGQHIVGRSAVVADVKPEMSSDNLSTIAPSIPSPTNSLRQESQSFILPTLFTSILWMPEPSLISEPHSQHREQSRNWLVEANIMSGLLYNRHLGLNGLDNAITRDLNGIESGREYAEIQVSLLRQLYPDLYLGTGLSVGYGHVLSRQVFTDSTRVIFDDHVVEVIRDRNGNVTTRKGGQVGNNFLVVERNNHQIHAAVTIPVIIKYKANYNQRLFLDLDAGVDLTILHIRKGYGANESAKDLDLSEIDDRYSKGLSSVLFASVQQGYRLSPQLALLFGLNYKHHLFGTENTLNDTRHQQHKFGFQLGLQKTL